MKLIKIVLLIFLLLIFLSLINSYVFPLDILNYSPLFSLKNWQSPHNSLLADPVYQFEPWRIFIKSSILRGEFPFWNSLNAGGVPLFANPITAIFSIPNIIYIFFPINISLQLSMIVKVLLFIYFTYLYLKNHIGKSFYAILGAINVSSGYFLLWLLWPQTNVYLFFPLILFLIDKYIRKKNFIFFILLAFTFFLSYLGGHPETFFLIGLVSLIYGFIVSKRNIRLFFDILLSILVGLLLSSFQLIPFLEYLLNSYMLVNRATLPAGSSLPLIGILYNFFPLILGAPNLHFYKPLFNQVNYQELAGGYVGLIPILFAFYAVKKYFKDIFVKVWTYILIFSVFLAYKIPIITNIVNMTPLKINANERFIAFIGFSIVMLFVYGLYKMGGKGFKLSKKVMLLMLIVPCLILLTNICMRVFTHNFPGNKFYEFGIFLLNYLFLVALSTDIFVYLISNKNNIRKSILYTGLFTVLFVQSILFFWNYSVVFSSKDQYYPNNEITRILKEQNSRYIQIGNPNFSPDLNLAYSIGSAENYDALDINAYKKYFDSNFKDKNIWGNVDSASLLSLQRLGIANVVSDYDINNKKININHGTDKIFPLLDKKNSYIFEGNNSRLNQVRILTANYNRSNDCFIRVELLDNNTQENLATNMFSCLYARDKMFYSIDLPNIKILNGNFYKLVFSSINSNNNNYIGLVGDAKGIYLDLLVDSGERPYSKEFNEQSVYLFKVPNVNLISGVEKIKILNQTPTQISLIAENKVDASILIKYTSYPGWEVFVDGKKTNTDKYPFIKFKFPKGEHLVDVTYTPYSFYFGSLVSIITTITIVILFIVKYRKMQTRIFGII